MARLTGKRLAELTHRVAVATDAGVDIRRTLKREGEQAPRAYRGELQSVAAGVDQGRTLTDSVKETGPLFPALWREMVGIGEKTGQLPEVLHRLSDHYQFRHDLNRTFLGLIAWPLIQLALAILVIGLMILLLGVLGGGNVDPLGFGLLGVRGATIYAAIVAAGIAAVAAVVMALRRGAMWAGPIQSRVTSLYGIGDAIQKVCLARIAWALHLTLNVEMDLRQLVPLVLRASGNEYYIRHTRQMTADVAAGRSLYETFLRSKAFPPTFLDALQVAEESGQISESMSRLTSVYEQEARSAMETLAAIAGVAIWIGVAAVIITMIFRLFFFYLNTLKGLTDI